MIKLPKEVLDGFAASYAVACAFATDPEGRALIVKPTYRDEWQFVGGMVDRGESPHEACAREVKEEIGIDLAVGDLLVLDYVPNHAFVSAPMTIYIFDCGTVDDPDRIRLQEDELEAFAFLPADEAASRFHTTNGPRLSLAVEARRTGRTTYVPRLGWEPPSARSLCGSGEAGLAVAHRHRGSGRLVFRRAATRRWMGGVVLRVVGRFGLGRSGSGGGGAGNMKPFAPCGCCRREPTPGTAPAAGRAASSDPAKSGRHRQPAPARPFAATDLTSATRPGHNPASPSLTACGAGAARPRGAGDRHHPSGSAPTPPGPDLATNSPPNSRLTVADGLKPARIPA